MVEQAAVNRKVEGSSPSLGANFFLKMNEDFAGMAELADAQDLKSCDPYRSYRFDPGLRHQYFFDKRQVLVIIYRKLHNIIQMSRGRAVGSSSGS